MPKNVENFEIRTLGRDDYAQAAEIFAFVHALHQANRPDIYRKTNVPLGEDEFFKMCDDPHEIMLCAVRDGKILGLARTVMRGNAGDAGGYGGAGRVAAGTGHGHRHGVAVCERGGSEAPRCGIFGADGVVV